MSYPWSSSCVVMEGGISLSTQNLQVCSDSALHTTASELSVSECDQRILIYQVDAVDLAEEFIPCSSFDSGVDGDCDKWVSDGDEVSSRNGLVVYVLISIGYFYCWEFELGIWG